MRVDRKDRYELNFADSTTSTSTSMMIKRKVLNSNKLNKRNLNPLGHKFSSQNTKIISRKRAKGRKSESPRYKFHHSTSKCLMMTIKKKKVKKIRKSKNKT